MPIDLASFRKWIEQIYATQEHEPDCDTFMQLVPQYVDLQVAGRDVSPDLTEIEAHLRQCSRCSDLYLALYEAALAEAQDEAEPTGMAAYDRPVLLGDDDQDQTDTKL